MIRLLPLTDFPCSLSMYPFFFFFFFFGWVALPAGMGFDFIIFVPLLPSCCGFFVFGHGVSFFFGGFQCPPVDGSTASFNFGVLTGD